MSTLPWSAKAQGGTVPVGRGSYSTTPPDGPGLAYAIPPRTLYVTGNVADKVPSNKWWSSLVFKCNADNNDCSGTGAQPSNPMYAHPLAFKAELNGLGIGYPTNLLLTATQYNYPYREDVRVGLAGMSVAPEEVRVDGFSDWAVTADWGGALKATMAHGSPYVYFTIADGIEAEIRLNAAPTTLTLDSAAARFTVNGHHYALFAPSGASWEADGPAALRSTLDGKGYFSLALLPDTDDETFRDFAQYAYAFVVDTRVSWAYDEANAMLTTTFQVTTDAKEGSATGTLQALYRHQWLNGAEVNTAYEYVSPRGVMKVVRGAEFSTRMAFQGVLPWLPLSESADRDVLAGYVREVANTSDPRRFNLPGPGGERDPYWSGKGMHRVAQVIPIADQLGMVAELDSLLASLKGKLEDWFTASGEGDTAWYYYDELWGALSGYPAASFGANTVLNDHHFHAGYYVFSAAIVALFDPEWAVPQAWGGMVDLLLRDAANWDSADEPRFARLRNWDPYAGHSWASGAQTNPGQGANQESSSEAMLFAGSMVLWGQLQSNRTMRDLGIAIFVNEQVATEQYWFDVDDAVFPATFEHPMVGIVWSSGGAYTTWFSQEPEAIHGINVLPMTPMLLSLGRYPEYIPTNLDALRARQPRQWLDLFWAYEALADAPAGLAHFGDGRYAESNAAGLAWAWTQEWGETRAHTYQFLHALNQLGRLDTSVTADAPTCSVFVKDSVRSYVCANLSDHGIDVEFSDGFTVQVAPRSLAVDVRAVE